MGHPDEDLIRRGYDAFSRGDMDVLRDLFQPDIVWHAPDRSQLTVLGYFRQTMELTGGNFRVEVHDIIANDEHAIGLHTTRAEREGKTLQGNDTLCSMSATGRSPRSGGTGRGPYTADELFASTALRAQLAGNPSSTWCGGTVA